MSKAQAVCHGDFGRVMIYQLNRGGATHVHREGHLVFFIKGARPSLTVNDRKVPVGPGQAAAVNPWERHSFEACPSGDDSYLLVVYVNPGWFNEASVDGDVTFEFGRHDLEVNLDVLRQRQLIATLLLDQADTETDSGDHNERIADAVYHLMRMCFEQSWKGVDVTNVRPNISVELTCSDPRVKKALALMRAESAADVSLDDVAKESGLSRPHFFKLFKDQTGITPNLYLNTLRMERALLSLTDTDMSVTEIAYDLGFSSQASFTRFFCMNVGIPPSDYRRVASTPERVLYHH